jgi:hypothetical protein
MSFSEWLELALLVLLIVWFVMDRFDLYFRRDDDWEDECRR